MHKLNILNIQVANEKMSDYELVTLEFCCLKQENASLSVYKGERTFPSTKGLL